MASEIFRVDLDVQDNKVINLADPTDDQDAANKRYVDASVVGFGRSFKDAARVAATSNVTISSPGASIDGVSLSAGNRVLLTAQSTASQNGLWVWNGASSAMTRPTDFDAGADVDSGAIVPVEEGTQADTIWILTTNAPITIGSTSLAFSKLAPATTGVSKYTTTIGDGAATSYAVTHSLGTKAVIVQLWDTSSDQLIHAQVVATSTSVVTVDFNSAPASSSVRVVVMA